MIKHIHKNIKYNKTKQRKIKKTYDHIPKIFIYSERGPWRPRIILKEWLSSEEINQRLHYFNLTNDWSAFKDVPEQQHVSIMYPESFGVIGETIDQRKLRLIEQFGPLGEEWIKKANRFNNRKKKKYDGTKIIY